jgi:hypothetical protein
MRLRGNPAGAFDLAGDSALSLRMTPTPDGAWQPIGGVETLTLAGVQVPTQRFKKDVIYIGEFVKVNDGLKFTVTPRALANWVLQFQRMKANGVKVALPDTHENVGNTKHNMGWVDDVWIEKDVLWMSCTIIGKDALEAARKADVSVHSPKTLVDGKGNVYDRPIDHIAFCTDPVVPGLGDFVPLAASLAIRLQGESNMDPILDLWQTIGSAMGLDKAAMTDVATASKMVLEALDGLLAKVNEGATADPTATGTATVPASGAPAGAPAGTVRKETVIRDMAASQGDDKPNPMVVKTLAENRELKISGLVNAGKISPATAEKLGARFIGKDKAAVALALSQGSDGSDFDAMIEALEANTPVELGEKTGVQSFSLGDPQKKAESGVSPLVTDADQRAEQAAKATARAAACR